MPGHSASFGLPAVPAVTGGLLARAACSQPAGGRRGAVSEKRKEGSATRACDIPPLFLTGLYSEGLTLIMARVQAGIPKCAGKLPDALPPLPSFYVRPFSQTQKSF